MTRVYHNFILLFFIINDECMFYEHLSSLIWYFTLQATRFSGIQYMKIWKELI